MLEIESSTNSKIKKLKSLKIKKVRDNLGLFLVEGKKMIDEALTSSFKVLEIYISEGYYNKYSEYVVQIEKQGTLVYKVKDYIIKSISYVVTPQGIIGVVEKKEIDFTDYILKGEKIILLDKISDPGNLGTIIRTADAFSFPICFHTNGSVDIYNEKVIRATMGSIFRVAYILIKEEYFSLLKKNGYSIIGMTTDGESLDKADLNQKCVVTIGNEANGISKEILDLCDKKVTIKMSGKTESLNAAVSAAIAMFEISK